MNKRRGAIVPGLMLVLLGAWLLAQNLAVDVPGIDQLWPAIPLVFGIGFLAQYFVGGRQEEGMVFVGVAGALVGGFFLAITLGPLVLTVNVLTLVGVGIVAFVERSWI